MKMFWGLVLKANKKYSQTVSKSFHISQATLDLQTSAQLGENDHVQVWVTTDDVHHLLCNLTKSQSQCHLDLAFAENETIAFFSKGTGTVHLTGFLMPEDEPPFPEEDFGEEEEEEEEDEVIKANGSSKKKVLQKIGEVGEDDDDDDESDDSDYKVEDDLNGPTAAGDADDSDSDDDEEDLDDLEDDDEDDEDESDEEAVVGPPAKQQKVDKTIGLTNGKAPKEQKKPQQQQQEQKKKENKQVTPQQKVDGQKQTPKKLAGGVLVEDLRVGKGPDAKPGRQVTVYYEGRLKSNNKVFDSTKSGNGFTFKLGGGEVIQAWDIGVSGMKVGSKRRLTCPPATAYGAKGAAPAIPPNATLVFDVELRGVK